MQHLEQSNLNEKPMFIINWQQVIRKYLILKDILQGLQDRLQGGTLTIV